LAEVIVQERLSVLAGPPRQVFQNAGDGAFRDFDAEHFQLAVNFGCTP
jgi:hypothetical protein